MLFKKSPQASEYSGLKLMPNLGVLSTALLLASCGADVSNETAMADSLQVTLSQCEVQQHGVVGTPIDPVMVNGDEVNACLLNKDIGQLSNTRNIVNDLNIISLKQEWNYKPLVWVLDGVYEFGESKEYETLNELLAERVNLTAKLYAKPGSVVILHRNAQLTTSILSLDDNNTGGGEWGGVVINGIGYSPECPATSSPDQLCNIKGPFGYYGGVAKDTDLTAYGMSINSTNTKGFPGLYSLNSGGGSVIGEAGEEVSVSLENYAGGTIHAAVTAYAPAASQTGGVIAYSGSNGLQVYGGSYNIKTGNPVTPIPYITNTKATALELNNYQGDIAARIRHGLSTAAALVVKGGQVDLSNLSLFDQYNQAGVAISVANAAKVTLDDALVQGFDTCLAPQDSASQISMGSALLNCSNITNNTSNALAAIADATDLITGADALLSYIWAVGNNSLNFANVEDVSQLGAGNANLSGVYSPAILFPECLGVGTLAEDTLVVGGTPYQICDLTNVDQSATLSSNFSIEGRLDNGGKPDYYPKNIAWRINGQVQVGTDFTPLNSAEQAAALASPVQLTLPSSTKLVATSNNDTELVIQPDARLRVAGSSTAGVEVGAVGLGAGDITSSWRGISVNGHNDAEQQLDIHYLRLFDTGEDGQAALTLNEVDGSSQIAYLDIYGAGADGLNINGGAVNFDHLVMANIAGDQIAWSNGYTGTIETAIVSPGDDSTGHVLHGINDSTDYDASPRSRPVITNITAAGFGSANTAVLLEQGSGLLMFNSVFSEFATCLDIDDAETAALQSSDPQEILFDGVIFSCENTLAADSEDSGYDYGYTVASSGGVYEEDPVLDTGYVITGDTLASQASLSSYAGLIGDSYSQLNDAGYIGAVSDSNDNWYNKWSDSVVITPDYECNNLGILTALDSELTAGAYRFGYDTNGDGEIVSTEYWYPASKSCRILGGIYTNNVTISQYAGLSGETVEQWLNDGYTLEEIQADALTGGWAINSSTGEARYIEEAVMRVAPIHWSIKGIVHIGNGHQEITDVDTVAEMKANPTKLTVGAGVEINPESDGSILHITRSGSLSVEGVSSESGEMVHLFVPLIIDGFGRHNQCENANIAEPGIAVCNIQGDYGYYGGYDNEYANVDISFLYQHSILRLNSVGSGMIESLYLDNSNALSEFGDAGLGMDFIRIDGGSINFRYLYFTGVGNIQGGSYLYWSHGYQGTLQYVGMDSGASSFLTPSATLMADDSSRFYPMIRGENVLDEEWDESTVDLPRSMPTLSNFVLAYEDFNYPDWGFVVDDGISSLVDLSNDSGLFLYNSVMGSTEYAASVEGNVSYCFYFDSTIKKQLGSTLVINNLTTDCDINNLANNPDSSSYFADLVSDDANSSVFYYEYAMSESSPADYPDLQSISILNGISSLHYPYLEIIKGADLVWNPVVDTWPLGYSSSQTVNADVIEDNNYIGAFDYSLVFGAGEDIED